jgi:hypothetical protein
MSEQTREDREQQVEDLKGETEMVTPNVGNTEHERWLETGETEPEFMIPQPDEDEDDEEGDEE